jgi:hypothetical protein
MTCARERPGMSSCWSFSSEKVSQRKQEAPELRAQRQNQNLLWNYGKPSHLPTVPQYGGDRDGYIYGSDRPNKAKTKQKNSLDSKTQKRDNEI